MQQLDWLEEGDDPFPPIEGRTPLFGLPPIGLGTPDCESLSSYVIRLAREHSLPPRRFISRIVLGGAGQGTPLCDAKFFRQYAATVNGLGQYAERFVDALGQATGRGDLASLTMLPWKDLLAPNGAPLTHATRRWCAACLLQSSNCQAPNNQKREAYWPLSWSISAVSCCVLHGDALSDLCPHCGRRQPTLPKHAEFDQCDHCRRYLHASDEQARLLLPQPLSAPAVAVADLVGQMIRIGPTMSQEGVHKRWCEHIAQRVAAAGSDRASACRDMGLNPRAMYEWFERGARAGLGSVLKVCLHLGISMDSVLGAPDSHVPSANSLPPQPSTKGPRKKHDLTTRVLAKEALDHTLGDPARLTLRAVSERLGVSTGYLRYWFPREVAALNAIRRRRVLQEREMRQRRAAALIETTVRAMVEVGTYPGRKRVENALRADGTSLMSSPNLHVYRAAIRRNVK